LTLRTSAIAVATGRAGITISAALWTHLPAWPRLAPPAKPRPVLLATGAAEMRRRRRGACAESLGGTWGLARAMSSSVISADEVRACLRAVMEPNLQANVVALDFVRNITVTGAGVSFDLVLNTPACPTKETLKQTCIDAVAALPWVESVDVHLSAEHRARKRDDPKTQAAASSGLKDVKRIIAVSSAKGGVGKSTVSVNLAYAIARLGGKVGIFDADVQGPSLPTMVALENPKVVKSPVNDSLMVPLEYEGVKLMSYGFSAKARKGQAAVMRGPMVASTVSTLLKSTDWGPLDYMIIDLPPGTGDIHLTLCQELNIDGAVIVTTPQKLSFVDVIKGLQMFDTLNVPIVALVENMSYFDCGCGQRHYPFGKGHAAHLASEHGTPPAVVFPIREQISERGDGGHPLVLPPSSDQGHLDASDAQVEELFMHLASTVVQQMSILEMAGDTAPLVEFDPELKNVTVWPTSGSAVIWGIADLREACLSAKKAPPLKASTRPLTIAPKGRYAVEMKWSDGHTSIFPYTSLLRGPLPS